MREEFIPRLKDEYRNDSHKMAFYWLVMREWGFSYQQLMHRAMCKRAMCKN